MLVSRLVRLILSACICFSCAQAAMAAPASSSKSKDADTHAEILQELAVIKETTPLRLEAQQVSLQAQKESLQKDLQILQSKIEAQGVRIEDINAATNRFSIALSVFGLIITVLVAAAGTAAWYSAGAKAREAAQEWIKQHESELISEVKRAVAAVEAKVATVESRATQASHHIQEQIAAVEDKVAAVDVRAAQASQHFQMQEKTVTQAAEAAKAQMQTNLALSTPPAPTAIQKNAIEAEERRLTQKPESDYTFKDWESRAFAAYANEELDLAASFFQRAAKADSATREEVARSLFNRALMLDNRGHRQEAIDCYEEVLSRLG
ncbi:hypothetical protein ATI61_1071, partial [Archangium gephyra]